MLSASKARTVAGGGDIHGLFDEDEMTDRDEQLIVKAEDRFVWFTTVTPSGRPAPRPVWFVYQDGEFVVFSEATAAKVRHLRANPRVSLAFPTDPAAEHVLVVAGTAVLAARPRPSELPRYMAKYETTFPAVGYDTASFDRVFDTCIRVTVDRSWGF